MKATRHQIFAAIDGELDFQDAGKGNSETDRTTTTVGDGVALIQAYANRAIVDFSGIHPAGREAALHTIRKIAALCVRTMIENGAPIRKDYPGAIWGMMIPRNAPAAVKSLITDTAFKPAFAGSVAAGDIPSEDYNNVSQR